MTDVVDRSEFEELKKRFAELERFVREKFNVAPGQPLVPATPSTGEDVIAGARAEGPVAGDALGGAGGDMRAAP